MWERQWHRPTDTLFTIENLYLHAAHTRHRRNTFSTRHNGRRFSSRCPIYPLTRKRVKKLFDSNYTYAFSRLYPFLRGPNSMHNWQSMARSNERHFSQTPRLPAQTVPFKDVELAFSLFYSRLPSSTIQRHFTQYAYWWQLWRKKPYVTKQLYWLCVYDAKNAIMTRNH